MKDLMGVMKNLGEMQARMQKIYEAGVFDPEAFRTRMAQMRPEEIGLDPVSDAVLSRFQLSLLTEGSGTQVFATTFVQWAAREALRRAQPLTLLTRFAPRQRENPMNELLSERIAAMPASLPMMLVSGEKSEVVDADAVEEFRRQAPQAELVAVSRAGHIVAGDRNDDFSYAISGFLKRRVE